MKKVVTMEQKQKVLDTFNQNPSGCFVQVSGYENQYGEISDYQIQAGVKYFNIVQDSVDQLKDIQAGKVVEDIEVTTGVWENPNGTITNRKAKDRTYKTITVKYAWDSDEFQNACEEIKNSLLNPRESNQTFEQEAKGLYSMDVDTLYIRECLIVNKKVLEAGEYPQTASLPEVALKNKIRGMLKVSKYRTFKLENFDSISINNTLIF